MCRFGGTAPDKPCSLPGCVARKPGEPAFGRKRPPSRASKPGRTKREQAHLDANPWCFYCGRKATQTHHEGGRGLGGYRRDRAALTSSCGECHEKEQRSKKLVKVSGEPIVKGEVTV